MRTWSTNPEESKAVLWGLIEQIDPEGIVIESTAIPSKTQKTALGDIDLLAVAVDRTSLERWREARMAASNVTVLYRGEVDLSQLQSGSYAHVVYTWKGFKRTASGNVQKMAPGGIAIKSPTDPPEAWKISAADIDTIAFSKPFRPWNGGTG